jgi:hypothetical protein
MKLLYMFSIFLLISIIFFMSYNNTIIEGNRCGGRGKRGGIGAHNRDWNNVGTGGYGYGGRGNWVGYGLGYGFKYHDNYNDALYYQPIDNLCYNRYGNVTHCPTIRPYF